MVATDVLRTMHDTISALGEGVLTVKGPKAESTTRYTWRLGALSAKHSTLLAPPAGLTGLSRWITSRYRGASRSSRSLI